MLYLIHAALCTRVQCLCVLKTCKQSMLLYKHARVCVASPTISSKYNMKKQNESNPYGVMF